MKVRLLLTVCFALSLAAGTLLFTTCTKESCKDVNCQNGGTLPKTKGNCTCECPPGFSGSECETKACNTSGTAVNIGSTGGGSYFLTLGTGLTGGGGYCNGGGNCPATHDDRLEFNNTNLNFSMQNGCTPCGYKACTLVDVGFKSCLDFADPGNATANVVAYASGHGYVGTFGDGHTVKFITGTYSGGIVKVSYVFQ